MSKKRAMLWARCYHLEVAQDRLEKDMDSRAAALKHSLSPKNKVTLWGNPETATYLRLTREELHRLRISRAGAAKKSNTAHQ